MSNDEIGFKTPFDLLEENFMRLAEKGCYTPTINEIEALLFDDKVSYVQAKLLFYIKHKTINFWNTHCRLKRRDLFEAVHIDKSTGLKTIRKLIDKQYLLEKKDTDDYYYYALHPVTFGGLIVVNSIQEGRRRINVQEKKRFHAASPKGGKKPPQRWQKTTSWVVKNHPDEVLTIQNYSDFEMLKYTLLKYTLQNAVPAQTASAVIKILEETSNPESMMLSFVDLLHRHPRHSIGICKELIRANTQRVDCYGKPIKTNPVSYVLACWDMAKHYWQNIVSKFDDSEQATTERQEIYDLIKTYPLPNNVVQFGKSGA